MFSVVQSNADTSPASTLSEYISARRKHRPFSDYEKDGLRKLLSKEAFSDRTCVVLDDESSSDVPEVDSGEAAITNKNLVGRGIAASKGEVTGSIAFKKVDILTLSRKNMSVILIVGTEADADLPEKYLVNVAGIVAVNGGMSSKAAIIARKKKIPAITGTSLYGTRLGSDNSSLVLCITEGPQGCLEQGKNVPAVLKMGDRITVDGTSGNLYVDTDPLFKR
jgi:phosphohistidine swiveling domain-containing protein